MDYRSARQYLFSLGRFGIKPGLERIRALLAQLDNPHAALPAIHVAGTNGKGSVCAMLESILSSQGYRVGLYTSPHLICLRERVRIGRELVGEDFVAEWTTRMSELPAAGDITFFEAMTAMAFSFFAERKVDCAILETGLGGRWDATNAADARLAVITSVGLDHTDYLGHTLKAIAEEKAGIIKPGSHVITCQTDQTAENVIRNACEEKQALLVRMNPEQISGTAETLLLTTAHKRHRLKVPLAGRHQHINAALAVMAAENAKDCLSLPVHAKHIERGISQSLWPARFQVFCTNRSQIVIDAAHNPDGIDTLIATYRQNLPASRAPLFLMAFSKDKEYLKMLSRAVETGSRVLITRTRGPRALKPGKALEELARHLPGKVDSSRIDTAPDPERALAHPFFCDATEICAAGSIMLAGELLGLIGTGRLKGRFAKGHSKMLKWLEQVKAEFGYADCEADIR